jgi:hypothetical protein
LFVQHNKIQSTVDMKKLFVLSMLIPCALVCSCQKHDSTAEQQLAQRKAELDAREKALDEREKALATRENLAAKPRIPAVPRVAPAEPQRTVPPELKGLIADPSQGRADREQRMQERLAQRQRRMEEIQKMRAARALPRPQATAPATEEASPTPSPTPE